MKRLLFALLVGIHLISNLPMEQPMIMADELGYLGNARYLAGAAHLPDLQDARFYHFGYSLLLVPAFWLFSDPQHAYRAALTLNALLMSSLFLVLCSLLESLGRVPRRVAMGIAFVCSLYPPIILYSGFAWAECAFIPMYALTAVLLGRYLRSRTTRDALLFGLLAGLLYTVHPRALPIPLLAVGYLLLVAALGIADKRRAALGAAAAGLVFGLTRIGNHYLEGLGWAGTGEFSTVQLASRMLPDGPLKSLALRAAGQLFYMAVSTYGLVLLGLVAISVFLWRRLATRNWRQALADPRAGMCLFLLLSGVGIFVGSTALKVYSLFGRDTLRAANFIFGRYNEPFAAVMMALGLAWLWRSRLDRPLRIRQAATVLISTLAVTALLIWQIQIAIAAGGPTRPWLVEAINIAGVYPFVDRLGMPRLYLAGLVAIMVFGLLSLSIRRSFSGSLALLVVLFGAVSVYCERVNLQPARKATADRLSFVPELRRLGPPETLDYDFAFRDYQVFYGAQFLLPETVFHRFHSRKGELPASEVILSGKGWGQATALEARFVVSAAAGDTAVWVLPGQTGERLASPSLVGANIGVEPGVGIEEWGFYPPEQVSGRTVRWTNGAAGLRVPWPTGQPPRLLAIEVRAPDPSGVRLEVAANGVELWNGWIPEVWSRTLSLTAVPPGDFLTLELNCDTVNPLLDIPGARDNRNLGVRVEAIRLLAESSLSPHSYLDRVVGNQPIDGIQESGFHATEHMDGRPVRWTNGAASLRIPFDPQRPPLWLEIEVASSGHDGARLQILVNGLEVWRGRIPDRGLAETFDLGDVPLAGSALLELRSDFFVPAQRVEGSSDKRTLGVLVKGVRLTRAASPSPRPSEPIR